MRIGMLLYDMQPFGGLEEYAVTLAVALKGEGNEVSFLSTAWVPAGNQYALRLKENRIPLYCPPKWLSGMVSDWPTKESLLRVVMLLLSPITWGAGLVLALRRRQFLRQAQTSARNWLKGRIMDRVIGPDRRGQLGPSMLGWWSWRWKPDVLHIQGYTTTTLFAIGWAHRHRLPVVYEEHQTPDAQFNWWKGFEKSINKADRVLAVSEKSAEGLRLVCGVTRPIDVRGPLLVDPYARGWEKEIRAYDPALPFIVTTVARLSIAKGLTHLLDAVAEVKISHPNIKFRVYGDGDLKEELLEKARRLGLDGAQIFQGIFTDHGHLKRILEETDIFLLPSILEGQPLVIAEAMAHGCPIVSTNVGGIPELIRDEVEGLLCPPADPHCLAWKVIQLAEDPARRRRLSCAARGAFEAGPFSEISHSGSVLETYRNAMKARAHDLS